MVGRTWKNIDVTFHEEIISYIVQNGGQNEEIKNEHEINRFKFSDSTLTFYKKGTIYCTPSNSNDPEVYKLWDLINYLEGSEFNLPKKEFVIGLDETGKGEIVGHTILTGAIFPREIYQEIDRILGPADTKRKHKVEYWDNLFKKLDNFRKLGLRFIIEKIPPWHVDKYNYNKIMDVTYQRILSIFFRKLKKEQCRVVIDDYGIGLTLDRFLKFLEIQGAEVVVSNNAEDKYVEARVASIISKRYREIIIKSINENEEFQVNGKSIGSGNVGNTQTLDWLRNWHSSGKEWPWFIKRSFKTIQKIEGRKLRIKKETPPIREELLSKDFTNKFNQGNLSIQSLSLVCPNCGNILKYAAFANFNKNNYKISGLKCPIPSCKKIINDAGFTLSYYCGYIVPDSNAITRNIISNDLAASKFFENFTVILCPVVRKECDGTPRGKKEFEELTRYEAKGRIKLETIGKVEDLPINISSTVRDERIINICLEYNVILLTGDKSMNTFSIGKEIFTIFI